MYNCHVNIILVKNYKKTQRAQNDKSRGVVRLKNPNILMKSVGNQDKKFAVNI